MKRLLFVYNPTSGKGAITGNVTTIVDAFTKAGWLVTIYPTQGSGDATRVTRELAPQFDRVVCCGGDGTLSETAAGLLALPQPPLLGYIPSGSTNDCAATLRIPQGYKPAAELAAGDTPPLKWDIGTLNDRPFVYVAAFGAFTEVAYDTPQELKNTFGHLAYIMAGIASLPSITPYHLKLEYDGQTIEDDFFYGMVCNTYSVGGIKNLPTDRVDLNDGLFEVILVRKPMNIFDIGAGLQALLRPGRFDRQVYVGHPDIKGREAILKVHARNKPLGDDVSLAELAKGTGGFTGADLENLMNEAALLAARRHHRFISMAELNEAVIKVIAGPEKKSRVVIERERKLTAYHEAGHAIVIHDLPTQDPVHEITIIPRGMAGGMTISLPQEDVTFQTRQQLTERIAVCLGGRAAEQLALGDISTGAGNDLQKASAIARNMVTRYGMSEKVGNVVFDSGHDEVFIGRSMAQTKNYSEEVAALIDEEVKALVDGAYARCGEILTHRRRELDIVAEYLLRYENMDAKTFEQVFTDPAALQPPAAYQAVEAEAEQDAREEEEHGAD